jgi:hypothetical protein
VHGPCRSPGRRGPRLPHVFAQVIGEPSERRTSRFLDEAGADFWGVVIPPVVGEGRAGRRMSAKKPR